MRRDLLIKEPKCCSFPVMLYRGRIMTTKFSPSYGWNIELREKGRFEFQVGILYLMMINYTLLLADE